MDPELSRALAEVVVQIATALAVALGGWIASRLPGPLRDVMTANVHAKDVAVLVGAMQRRAMAEVANHATPPPTAAEIVEYMRRIKPDLLVKMNTAPEALETMAASALATATIATTAPAVVAPADVLVGSGDLSVALHRSGAAGG